MSLVRIFYISRCGISVTASSVRRIVGASQMRNRRRDITGLLAFSGHHFAQILEGRAADIDALLPRIERDPLHHDMRVMLRDDAATARRFGKWSMHLLDSPVTGDDLEALFAAEGDVAEAARRVLNRITDEARWHAIGDVGVV